MNLLGAPERAQCCSGAPDTVADSPPEQSDQTDCLPNRRRSPVPMATELHDAESAPRREDGSEPDEVAPRRDRRGPPEIELCASPERDTEVHCVHPAGEHRPAVLRAVIGTGLATLLPEVDK